MECEQVKREKEEEGTREKAFTEMDSCTSTKRVIRLVDVARMEHEEYYTWVYSNDKTVKRVELLPGRADALTKFNWRFVPLLWFFIILCLFPGRTLPDLLRSLPLVSASYYLLWPMIENALHRYLFHAKIDNVYFRIFHFLLHGNHHVTPRDLDRLVMPPVASVPIAYIIYQVILACVLFNSDVARSVLVGVLIGYVQYDCTHYALHAYNKKTFQELFSSDGLLGALPAFVQKYLINRFNTLKQNHNKHHFSDHEKNFPVSYIKRERTTPPLKNPRRKKKKKKKKRTED